MSTLDSVCARRIIPVVVVEDAGSALPLARALSDAGLPVAEVTFRTDAAAEAIRRIASETDVLVGAGTVVSPEQVDLAVGAGARFVVTPGFSTRVVDRCLELGVPVVPGVATATEVIAALDRGLDLLKFFPAEASGGVPVLRALAGPFPDVRWIPTGGISATNAAGYLELPAVSAVGGSWMVAPKLIAAGDFAEVSRLTAEAVRLAAEARP
ncbi:MAG: bifunctional 4-hydroxy-2-oxoglutarate aldolase/2-dehydro-3-deoxy-phosphogluconate aldolase [Gaiellaceae bacterium]